jgi:putative pantetheine hydrolase
VGAGAGALAGHLKGGNGAASEVLPAADGPGPDGPGPDGGPVTVAALAAVNAVGSVADSRTGLLYGARFGLPGEFDWLAAPSAAELQAGAAELDPGPRRDRSRDRPPTPPGAATPPRPLNTTIGVVATDASLTKAQCARLAGVA